MKALVLAAGYGTRMAHPVPKMFVEIEPDKPAITYNLRALDSSREIDELFLLTNNVLLTRFETLVKILGLKKPIKVLSNNTNNNEERLGSVGDIAFGINKIKSYSKIEEGIYIAQGDDITAEFNPDRFVEHFRNTGATSIVFHDMPKEELAGRFGVVELSLEGRVTGIEEKPEVPKTNYANGGYYILHEKDFRYVLAYIEREKIANPGEHTPVDKTGKLWKYLVEKQNVAVYGFRHPGNLWFDIGTVETLEKAKRYFSVE